MQSSYRVEDKASTLITNNDDVNIESIQKRNSKYRDNLVFDTNM